MLGVSGLLAVGPGAAGESRGAPPGSHAGPPGLVRRTKALTSPARADRPVNARVIAVRSKWGSVQRRQVGRGASPPRDSQGKAVPSPAQVAPAASAAPTSEPFISPPAPTRGRSCLAPHPGEHVEQRQSGPGAFVVGELLAGVHPPRRPGSRDRRADHLNGLGGLPSTVVTVTSTAEPADCSAATWERWGRPKVRLTTGTPA